MSFSFVFSPVFLFSFSFLVLSLSVLSFFAEYMVVSLVFFPLGALSVLISSPDQDQRRSQGGYHTFLWFGHLFK